MRGSVVVLMIAAALGGCDGEARALRKQGPPFIHMIVDVPRPAQGIGERWSMARKEGEAYLLHVAGVEQRRTHTTCGLIPLEEFHAGWEELGTAGLLRAGEDFRLRPAPGSAPFAARYQLEYVGSQGDILARRPLTRAELAPLLRVLRRWEARLQRIETFKVPAALRVEMGVDEACLPPKRRETRRPEAEAADGDVVPR
jgi:hypothetical protein